MRGQVVGGLARAAAFESEPESVVGELVSESARIASRDLARRLEQLALSGRDRLAAVQLTGGISDDDLVDVDSETVDDRDGAIDLLRHLNSLANGGFAASHEKMRRNAGGDPARREVLAVGPIERAAASGPTVPPSVDEWSDLGVVVKLEAATRG